MTSALRRRPRLRRAVATGVASAVVLAAVSGTLRPVSVFASSSTTVTVTTTADVSDGVTTSIGALNASPGPDNLISLREAITAADNTVGAGAVTVNVPAGSYTLASGGGGALQVGTVANSNISIVGAGAGVTTITGDGTNRVLALDPNLVGNITVAISGVTITGGHDNDGFGGAGLIGGNPSPPDTTTLSNCVVTGNHTTSSATNSPGGGIQYIGGSLSISNCTISSNSSGSSPGGGIDFETLTPHSGTFTLTNSTVTGNTLTNSDPTAFVGGAGVHVQAMSGSTVTMTGDTFTNNVATGSAGTGPVGGGGLWLEGGATITSATFTGNQANGPAATLAGGGALNLSTGSTTLAFSRITGNTASNGPGGVENNGAEAVTNAVDNWWGCNAGPASAPCDTAVNSGAGTGSLTVNPRLTLTATAVPTKLLETQSATVTAALTHDSTGADTSGSGHVPDGIAMAFAGTLGSVSPTGRTTAGGVATTQFTAGNAPGAAGTDVTVDQQTVTASIGIGVPPQITSASTTIFTSGSVNTFHVTATGTPTPTFSESGALPAGVSLNSSGVLTGTPVRGSGEGTYPITITATNGYGTDDTQGFTLTVVQAPVITSANGDSFTEAVAGSFPVTATGTPPVTFTESGALPTGVTLNSATGVLAGTPAPGSNGSYLITLTAHNAGLPDATQGFTLTVGLPPVITSLASGTLTTGTNGAFQVTATGYPAPTFSATGSLPTGVTLDAATGALGGTPAAGTGGQYPITLTASNGFGADATQSFTLTVDQAPAITSATSTTFTTGTAGTFTVTATGYPAPTFSASALPSGTGLDPTTGVLSGTPAALTGGAHAITITASNGVTPDATQGFTLTVDDAAAFTSGGAATFTAGTAGTFPETATGYPAPVFSETGTLPSGVSLDPTTGVLSGTPAAGTGGAYDLTLSAHDGIGADALQAFVLTVNEAPAFSSLAGTTFTVGAAGTFTVSATAAPAATLSESGTLPSGVTFTAGTGVLAGTPSASSGGSYPLTFTAHNGIGSDAVQPFTLTVNEAPAITSDGATTFIVGQPGTFTVTGGGFPSPTFTESGALPAGVTLDAATGVLSGTPGPGTDAVYPLTITAHNGVQPDATQSFTLAVNLPTQPAAITSAASTGFTEGSSGSFTVTATGLPAPGLGETGTLPPGVTFDTTTGVLSGTPVALSNGTYVITFTAHNGIGPDATQGFTLTVGLPPAITSVPGTTFTTGNAGSFAVTATGYPAPTFTETGALPSGVSLDPTTGALSGTPAAHSGGSYGITITASNGFAPDSSQSFTLVVDEAPAITSATGTLFTTGTPGSFAVTATGHPAPTFSETGALPSGVSLDPTTGALSGTPAALTGGTHDVTITAHNGVGGDAVQSFTLTIDEAASFSSVDSATFTVGTAGSFGPTAHGFPTPTFTESGLLPSGVTFSGGVLSGTPDALTGGTYGLTLTAHNGIGADATQAFTLTVDQAAAITSVAGTTFTVGAAGSFPVTATGVPAPTLQLGAGAVLPPGVGFDPGTGTLSGTPSAHDGSTYTFDVVAHNGIGADAVQPFTLTVNEAPALTSDTSTTFTLGSPGTFTVTAAGFPSPTLSEDGGDTLPGGVGFDAGTGVLSGTPVQTGDFTLHFTAHNSTQPDALQTFVLHVVEAPVFTSAVATTYTVGSAGTPLTVQASGFPAPSLTLTAGVLPSGVTFDSGTGVLSGSPAAGTGKVYPLTFTASNGVSPDATQAFTLTVDEAPSFTSTNATTFTAGSTGSFTVTATGFPAPGLSETPGDVLPAGVTFDPGTGLLGGIPAAGTGGTYTLHLGASNLIGSDATQTLTLTVDEAPAFSSAHGATFTAGTHGSFPVAATGHPTATVSEDPGDVPPAGVTFNPGTGVLSGTPQAATGGSYLLHFTASNGIGSGVSQVFTLTVDEAPVITVPATLTVTTHTAFSLSIADVGYPTPTYNLTWTPVLGIGFDPSTGMLSGTPAAGTAGDHVLTFSASNGVLPDAAAQSLTLTVKNATTTSIASSKLHTVAHEPVTLSATVVADTGTPTGTVLFVDGGSTTIGSGTLTPVVGTSGTATATYTTLPSDLAAGSHGITAVYAGDAGDSTSTSVALTQVVATIGGVAVTPHSHTLRANGTAHTSVTAVVTDAGGQPVAGDTVTFAATPGGRVSFSPASSITDSSGVATTTATAAATGGPVTLTATEGYGGVAGTANEKLLGVRFKVKALTTSHIPADGTSTTTATVLVVDGSGAPVSGEPVTFATEGHPGDATLAQPSVLTDTQGVATDSVTASTTAGTQAIIVSDDNADPADNFSAVLALTQLPAGGATNSSFIHNAYVTLLGRDADPAGYAFWLDRLDHGTSRSALAQALATSPEYRGDVIGGTSTVPGFYEQYLGRPSDPGGVAFWLGMMATGHSFEQVRLGFLGSTEYPLHHGNDPAATIEALYEDVLGRPSDPSGMAYWLANYNAATVAGQFISSAEGRAHLVSVLYGSVLDRAADSAGLSYWTQQLLNGATDEYLIGALLGSDEYFLSH